LDAGSLAALGPELGAWYGSRWERALPILGGSDGPAHLQGSPEPGSPASPPAHGLTGSPQPSRLTPALPAGPSASEPTGSRLGFAEAHQAAREAIDRAKRAVAAERLTGPRVDLEFERLTGGLADLQAVGALFAEAPPAPGELPESPLPADPRAAALAVLRRFGAAGGSGTAVHAALAEAGISVSLSRVYDYLNEAEVKVRHGVYVHPDHRSPP
jgi:hypothetical protein